WDFGADLGISADWFTPYFTMADKSALIRALFTEGAAQAAIEDALAVIINPLATGQDVTSATAAFTAPPEQSGAPKLTGLTATGLNAAGINFVDTVFTYTVTTAATNTASVTFTPVFDGDAYTLTAGADALQSGIAKSFTVAAGLNTIALRLTDKQDSDNYSDYIIEVLRPLTATLKSLAATPSVETLAQPLIGGGAEGTTIRAPGGVLGTASFTTATKEYRMFFLSPVTEVSLSSAPTLATSYVRVLVDGTVIATEKTITDLVIPLTGDITPVRLEVCTQATYNQNGGFLAEDAYTLSIEKLNIAQDELDNAKIQTMELTNGIFRDAFTPDSCGESMYVRAEAGDTVTYTMTTAAGTSIYKHLTSSTAANKLAMADGVYTHSGTASLPFMPDTLRGYQIALSSERILDGVPIRYQYKILYMDTIAGAPDEIISYMVPASQYTNSVAYGMNPDAILGGSVKSLGNFGGSVTVYYQEAIKNDPENPYGIDFAIDGNAGAGGGGAGLSEPGNVYVSKDGTDWYLLAGSDYFDDNTIRDYEVTYIRNADGTSGYRDNHGSQISIPNPSFYKYPKPANYPLYPWQTGEEDEITFSGPLLTSSASDPYGSAQAAYPDWGYVDVHATNTAAIANPYTTGYDGFDISWAIDAQGKPVELDEIHYIKVQTASHIYAGAIGEKSTEVSAISPAVRLDTSVGVTGTPDAIKLNGIALALEDDVYIYNVPIDSIENVNISVEGTGAGMVYINNAKGASRTYATAPKSGIVRVIVQEEDKEPLIYYITLRDADPVTPPDPAQAPTAEQVQAILDQVAAYEKGILTAPGYNSEWILFGLARGGAITDELKAAYLEKLLADIQPILDAGSLLSSTKSTEYSRVVLALTALGIDATDFAGYDLTAALADFDYVKTQGINGPIFALIALNGGGYDMPQLPEGSDKTQTTEDALLNYILGKALAGGGWALSGTSPDPDMTGMALQALAPYYGIGNDAVDAAVNGALTALGNIQKADTAGFASWGTVNAESIAQVLVALNELGISLTDTRFVKNDRTIYDALLDFLIEIEPGKAGFRHTLTGNVNGMATEQSAYTLVALLRSLTSDQTSLYDMSDVTLVKYGEGDDPDDGDDDGDDVGDGDDDGEGTGNGEGTGTGDGGGTPSNTNAAALNAARPLVRSIQGSIAQGAAAAREQGARADNINPPGSASNTDTITANPVPQSSGTDIAAVVHAENDTGGDLSLLRVIIGALAALAALALAFFLGSAYGVRRGNRKSV
ncbi:MAG: hypothetical protein LBN36_07570, partial [Clostridiales Family XIII bacterium]|nr:hypothetical protein [Clostridiales Family XIII bacterium]